MTIDEAIKERQKVIEVQEKLYEEASTNESKEIIKSATDNDRQLAEWLTELKELREEIGSVKLSNMKEALELIREYKAENIAQKKMIAEYKRLLKTAVEDIHKKCSCECSHYKGRDCDICEKHGNCSYADSFKWCKADIALKLIGESNEP